MRYLDLTARAALAGTIIIGIAALLWTWTVTFEGCAIQVFSDSQKAGIGEFSDITKWVLSLSVGFIGLIGSLILGLKSGPKLEPAAWTFLVAAMICFAWSAYFSLMWRAGAAEAFFIGCPELFAAKSLRLRFDALTYSFVAGLTALAVVLALTLRVHYGRKA